MRLFSLIVGDLLLLLALVFLGILLTAFIFEIVFPDEFQGLSLNSGIHFLMVVTLLAQGLLFQIGSIYQGKGALKLITVISSFVSSILFLVGVVTINLNWWIKPIESLLDVRLSFATPLSILLLVVLLFLIPFSFVAFTGNER